jgi:hypothetical protein
MLPRGFVVLFDVNRSYDDSEENRPLTILDTELSKEKKSGDITDEQDAIFVHIIRNHERNIIETKTIKRKRFLKRIADNREFFSVAIPSLRLIIGIGNDDDGSIFPFNGTMILRPSQLTNTIKTTVTINTVVFIMVVTILMIHKLEKRFPTIWKYVNGLADECYEQFLQFTTQAPLEYQTKVNENRDYDELFHCMKNEIHWMIESIASNEEKLYALTRNMALELYPTDLLNVCYRLEFDSIKKTRDEIDDLRFEELCKGKVNDIDNIKDYLLENLQYRNLHLLSCFSKSHDAKDTIVLDFSDIRIDAYTIRYSLERLARECCEPLPDYMVVTYYKNGMTKMTTSLIIEKKKLIRLNVVAEIRFRRDCEENYSYHNNVRFYPLWNVVSLYLTSGDYSEFLLAMKALLCLFRTNHTEFNKHACEFISDQSQRYYQELRNLFDRIGTSTHDKKTKPFVKNLIDCEKYFQTIISLLASSNDALKVRHFYNPLFDEKETETKLAYEFSTEIKSKPEMITGIAIYSMDDTGKKKKGIVNRAPDVKMDLPTHTLFPSFRSDTKQSESIRLIEILTSRDKIHLDEVKDVTNVTLESTIMRVKNGDDSDVFNLGNSILLYIDSIFTTKPSMNRLQLEKERIKQVCVDNSLFSKASDWNCT